MEQATMAPPKAKQDFSPGNTVRIGGSLYRVVAKRPPPRKGEAAIIELITHDLERRYEWQPFRGLRVIGGKPKRIRKRGPKAAPKVAQKVQRVSLWTRVARAFRRH